MALAESCATSLLKTRLRPPRAASVLLVLAHMCAQVGGTEAVAAATFDFDLGRSSSGRPFAAAEAAADAVVAARWDLAKQRRAERGLWGW